MSGICGDWSLGDAKAYIGPMLSRLSRRGPDGTRSWEGDNVALGHTLLATTPESLVEELPFSDSLSGCTITADARLDNRAQLMTALNLESNPGEIGDGELILKSYLRWGADCPKRLLGDFAFAIWDPRSKRMFCGRDHMGMRQLIYSYVPGRRFIFATEAEALVASKGAISRLNEARVADFLDDLESIDFTSTFFEGVSRLPPAHVLLVDANGLSVSRYWEIEPGPELQLTNDEAYEEAFLAVFTEAVRCRLRSVGSVGSMLSGGLDSNTVAAVAGQLLAETGHGPLRTFSAIASDLEGCAETQCIRVAARNEAFAPTLIDHAEVKNFLPQLIDLANRDAEPFDRQMTMIRAVYLAANHAGLNTILDGMSGDIVLTAGNSVARLLRDGHIRRAWREAKGRERFWGNLERAPRVMLEAAWSVFAAHKLRALRHKTIATRDNWALNRGRQLISKEFASRVNLRARRDKSRQLDGTRASLSASDRARVISHPALATSRERYDRVASALAIEPRDPFLDIRVIAFCLSLPPEQLEAGGWPKIIARRAVKGLVPDEVAWRVGKSHLGLLFIASLCAGDRATNPPAHWDALRRFLSPNTLLNLENTSTMDIRSHFKLRTLVSWLGRDSNRAAWGNSSNVSGSARVD